MENDQKNIEAFFHGYEKTFNDSLAGNINAAATSKVFADCFIAVSPSGVSCGNNDEAFSRTIIEGYNYYICCGVKSMKIISQSVIQLDEFHFLNKVKWESYYHVNEDREGVMVFDTIYFIQQVNGRTLIFGYITGDEKKAFRERGLSPDQQVQHDLRPGHSFSMERIQNYNHKHPIT